jgi:hypothetical protein
MIIKKRYQKSLLNNIQIELDQINSGFVYINLRTNASCYLIGYYLFSRDKITLFDPRKTNIYLIYLNVLHNSNKKWFEEKIKLLL